MKNKNVKNDISSYICIFLHSKTKEIYTLDILSRKLSQHMKQIMDIQSGPGLKFHIENNQFKKMETGHLWPYIISKSMKKKSEDNIVG